MPDCGLFDVGCQVVGSVSRDAFTGIAEAAGQAAADVLAAALTWWVQTPSPNPDSPAVRLTQSYLFPLIAVFLLASVLWQAIQIMITRRKEPALNVAVGLVRYAVTATLGLALIGGAVVASDDLAGWLVRRPMQDFSTILRVLLGVEAIANPVLLVLMALLGLLLGLVQWVLMFIRQAGILVLAGLLPLAASGSLNESTKPWMSRLVPWIVGLIAYKPIAALIYAIGFTLMGNARDFSTLLTGLVVIVLACVAMPVMMRFFTFTGLALGGGSSPASAVAGVAATGAAVGITLAGGGAASAGAAGQASFMSMTGPGSQRDQPPGAPPAHLPPGPSGSGDATGGSPPGPAPSGTGPSGTGPSGAGPTGGAPNGHGSAGAGHGADPSTGTEGPTGSGGGGVGGGGVAGAGVAGDGVAGGGAGAAASGAAGGAAGGAAAAGPVGAAAAMGAEAAQRAAQAPQRLGEQMTGDDTTRDQSTGGQDP